MIRVKICGIRSIEEMRMAVSAGADAVGVIAGIRHVSEDALEPSRAAEILRQAPPFVSTVLVTHQIRAKEVLELHARIPATSIQLHDAISPDEIAILRKTLPFVKLIKAVHVENAAALDEAKRLAPHVDALLLDTRFENRIGGTGRTHDWSISREIVTATSKPVILAGGLNDRNVREAIRRVRPFAVDANSGVEFPDGSKNQQTLKAFVHRAKTCYDPLLT